MANKTLFNEEEFEALDYLPHLAVMIYFKAIRPYMDYSTGITGIKRGISYRQFAEETEVETVRGRHSDKSGKVTLDSIRNAVQRLEKAGLIVKIPADKKLIFKLPLATINNSVQMMSTTSTPETTTTSAPQAKPAPVEDLDAWRGDMNPTPKTPMNPTHQGSGNNINTTTTYEPIENTSESGGGDFSLIFDNKITETEKKAIRKALPETDEETAQALLDELAGVMQTQEVKSKVSYFVGIVRRFKSGEFIPTAGITVAERRTRNEQQRQEALARQKQSRIPKEQRTNSKKTQEGRAKMRQMIGKSNGRPATNKNRITETEG